MGCAKGALDGLRSDRDEESNDLRSKKAPPLCGHNRMKNRRADGKLMSTLNEKHSTGSLAISPVGYVKAPRDEAYVRKFCTGVKSVETADDPTR